MPEGGGWLHRGWQNKRRLFDQTDRARRVSDNLIEQLPGGAVVATFESPVRRITLGRIVRGGERVGIDCHRIRKSEDQLAFVKVEPLRRCIQIRGFLGRLRRRIVSFVIVTPLRLKGVPLRRNRNSAS